MVASPAARQFADGQAPIALVLDKRMRGRDQVRPYFFALFSRRVLTSIRIDITASRAVSVNS